MKFRVFMSGSMYGPFSVSELFKLEGFSLMTCVCPDGDDSWEKAAQYPAITNSLPQKISGDYAAEPVAPESFVQKPLTRDERSNVPNSNWRQAVIGQDIPSLKLYSAPTSLSPVPEKKRTANAPGHQHRRKLLLLLGLASIAAYYPQTENLTPFLADFGADNTAISAMGYRFRTGGSPHWRGPGKSKAIQNISGLAAKPSGRRAAAAPGIIEIGSEDLGNGLILKTIVTTEIKDGVQTQRTTTLAVPHHPRRPKHGKN